MTITRREDYNWSSSVTGHTGPAHLESVTFVEVPETGVIIDELIAEEVDAVIEPDRDQRDRVTAAGLAIDDAIVAGIPYSLIPNVRKTALGDVKVRRALQKALKRQEIHDTVYGDGAAIASAPISSTTPTTRTSPPGSATTSTAPPPSWRSPGGAPAATASASTPPESASPSPTPSPPRRTRRSCSSCNPSSPRPALS